MVCLRVFSHQLGHGVLGSGLCIDRSMQCFPLRKRGKGQKLAKTVILASIVHCLRWPVSLVSRIEILLSWKCRIYLSLSALEKMGGPPSEHSNHVISAEGVVHQTLQISRTRGGVP